MMDLQKLTNVAIKAARKAGSIMLNSISEDLKVERKTGGSSEAAQVVTIVDQRCEEAILTALLPTCEEHGIALLTEESEDNGSRFKADYFWCIDPLDGTLPYVQKRSGYSVSIALVSKQGTPAIGIVYDPTRDNMYHAISEQGAFKNNQPWELKNYNPYLTYVTDRKLSDTPNKHIIEDMLRQYLKKLTLSDIVEIHGGGSVLNAIRVIENGPACMIKLPKKEEGGGSIWDYAATCCIFNELGLPATNYDGGSLDLNKRGGTFMNMGGVFYGNL